MAEEDFSANVAETRFRKGELLGKYRIESFSGFSSTGGIYSAVHEESCQKCSLHVISADISARSPELAARLLEKAEKASFFRHRAFCSVIETFTENNISVIVTELLQGKTLATTVKLGGCNTAFIGKAAADAMDLINAAEPCQHLIFDFTPENIFVENRHIKVLYPGILSELHFCSGATLAKLPALQRSAAFTAPEVLWGGGKPGRASNIYALGVLLFFLYTGSLPFAGKNICETMLQSLNGTHPDDPSVPPHMAALLGKMLSKEPDERDTGAERKFHFAANIREHREKIIAAIALCVLIFSLISIINFFRRDTVSKPDFKPVSRKTYRVYRPVQRETQHRNVPVPAVEKKKENALAQLAFPRHFLSSHAAPPQKSDQSLEERRKYSLLRLQQLEKESGAWQISSALEKFHYDKVQLRKRIILNLSARLRKNAGEEKKFFTGFGDLPPTPAALERFLLNGGSVTDRTKISPLSCAAAAGRSDLIPLLLCADACPEHVDSSGRTPLFYAYIFGNDKCVAMLLAAGADPERRDKEGKKAADHKAAGMLYASLRAADAYGAAAALAAGAQVDFKYPGGLTPLALACLRKNKEMAEFLIAKGAPIDQRIGGETLLSLVFLNSKSADAGIFEFLLKHGADTSYFPVKEGQGKSYMEQLCVYNASSPAAPEFARIMLSSGKFPLKKEELFSAVSAGSEKLIRVLVRHWPGLEARAYSSLYLHLLKHKKLSAGIARIMVERKMTPPAEKEFEKLLKASSDPELKALFPGRKGAADPVPENPEPASAETAAKEAPPVKAELSEKEEQAVKEVPTQVGKMIFYKKLHDQVAAAISGRQYSALESLLRRGGLHPDSIIQGMTLLQNAVRMDDRRMFDLFRKYGAYLYARAPQCELYPVALAARGNARLFKVLVSRKDIPAEVHKQLISVILECNNASALSEYLSQHGKMLKNSPQCYLTLALEKRSLEKILVRLIAFYRDFSAPKHRSVIHQALASDYRAAVINTLILRKARTDVKAAVMIGSKTFILTPLETARRVRSSSLIRKLLQRTGAK